MPRQCDLKCEIMFKLTAGLRQILAVDVLTGKAKQMLPDKHLRQPPEVEDQSVLRYGYSLQACCCSVHPSSELALCCIDFHNECLQFTRKTYVAQLRA